MSARSAELAELHLHAMYVVDEHGCIVERNPPGDRTPPLVHVVRTAEVNRWAFRSGVPLELREAIDRLLASEPVDARLPEVAVVERDLRALLAAAGIAERGDDSGPAFVLPRPEQEPGGVVRITEANSGLLLPHFADMFEDIPSGPLFVALADGVAVAHAHCGRSSPIAAVEAGVRTLEPFRGRGHATRAVRAWARAVYDEGRLPLYSTWWGNTASRRIAAALSGRQFAVTTRLP